MRKAALLIGVLLLLLGAQIVMADAVLPGIFSSNMVLQRDLPIRVWGKADPGESVTVTLADEVRPAITNASGDWAVLFSAREVGEPISMSVQGNNTLSYENILMGEVWVCSGQSNMQMSVAGSNDAEAEIAAADYPSIRLFSVPLVTADEPQWNCGGQWVACSPQTVPGFTAVGYFFGRALHKELDVPVGLINTSWGGTAAEAWTSMEDLQADERLHSILATWDQILADYPEKLKNYNEVAIPDWEKKVAEAKAKGEQEPGRPWGPPGSGDPNRPANLYNAMIAPLVNYGIRGAIWYQGESNAGRSYEYRTLFPAMIECWRDDWQQGDFPFGFVQLANFMGRGETPEESGWAELREAQSRTLKLDNTGQAVIIDIGDAADIHPRNKQDVGKRLAVWALAETYDFDIEYSGPVLEDVDRHSDRLVLEFDHVGDGLVVKGESLKGFAIAGADGKYVWAMAELVDDDEVAVWNPGVPHPKTVRYGWANNPDCTLYNSAGLPASPFRTDRLRGVTWPTEE